MHRLAPTPYLIALPCHRVRSPFCHLPSNAVASTLELKIPSRRGGRVA